MTSPSGPSGPAGVFDRASATYDAVGVPWFGPIAAGLVDALDPRPGERALDVGCGRGAALGPVARLVGPTGRAVGIDLAPGMVRRTAADLADLDWVDVRVDDASSPSLPPAAFDLVCSSLVLFFLDDPLDALQRWVRLLVPGGRLGVTTFGEGDPRWRVVDSVFEPYLPRRLRDAWTAGWEPPFDSSPGMEALLVGAGLTDVRTVVWTVQARFPDVVSLLAFTWSHGQRLLWEAVPRRRHAAVRAAAARRFAELAKGPGGLSLSQEVRCTVGRRPVHDG